MVYINDITEHMVYAEYWLYADMTLLCMDIANNGSSALQRNTDTVAAWSDTVMAHEI